jgi:hypothetical protein
VNPGGPDEEVLDARPRSRWLVVLLAAVVAAVVVRVVVSTHHSRPRALRPVPAATPTRAPTPNARPVAGAAVTSMDLVTATVGDTVYALDAGVLVTVDLDDGQRFVVHANRGDAMDGAYALLADPDHQRLWLVRAHDDEIDVSWFDTTTLAQTGRQVDRGRLEAAAVLDGRLYLSTSRGFRVLSQTEEVPAIPRPILPAADLMAADPVRHRLLLGRITAGPVWLFAQRPAARSPEVRRHAPFGKGQLEVAGGLIWAAGFGAHGAVLQRLDPRTLRPQSHSPLERALGPGALIVQADRRHLLVRSGGGGDALWCVDARTGGVKHYWPRVTGTPVLSDGGVFALVAGEPLARLDSAGCTA